MSNITSQEIDFMKNIQNIVSGSPAPSPAHVQGQPMPVNTGFVPDNSSMYIDDMKRYMMIAANHEMGNVMPLAESTNSPTPSLTSHIPSSGYEVVVDVNESGRVYYVKDSNRRIYENKEFHVFEAAHGTCKYLNNKTSINYAKEFITLDEKFHAEKSNAIEAKDNHNRAVKINESRAAQIFENNFKKYQVSANEIYADIKSLYEIVK